MTKLENALVWLYVKTWGEFGNHVIDDEDLWNFGGEDLEAAIMVVAYPRKKERSERVKSLKDLIMEKFEGGGLASFREWSGQIHDQVIQFIAEMLKKYFHNNLHLRLLKLYPKLLNQRNMVLILRL